MRVVHVPDSTSYQRAELRAAVEFLANVWWAGQQIRSQSKGTLVSYESLDINYPCWIRLHGVEQFPIVQFVQAADEDALSKSPPWPDATPVQPGVSWLEFDEDEEPEPPPDEEPEPPPDEEPEPPPGQPAHRVLMVLEAGSPNMIVKPSRTEGEGVALTIVQRSAEWFDRLDTLLGEMPGKRSR